MLLKLANIIKSYINNKQWSQFYEKRCRVDAKPIHFLSELLLYGTSNMTKLYTRLAFLVFIIKTD